MTLAEYLLEAARTPWKDGVHDCTAWPARWVGIPLPDDYATHGRPLSEVWGEWIGDRLELVLEPRAGDVGIVCVVTPEGEGEIGGIYTGEKWALLTDKGLATVRLPAENVIAVWHRG
ncbi:hypothetical protein [Novosphingobium sp. MBES04]|uniref:hypothetical protein n=1 Tax=Novosphingobium sp. MBES04 TaxID=1206458 RepID=UPI00057D0CD3|nr:hypothetical protein [Novosphingobium sp. MBES04]GAM06321.1 hypothetical protein MBENS4_3318 [Novosphingobium sp. MBES04]